MSKPWDNNRTPIVDSTSISGTHIYRNLERRMRAAERLLDITINDTYPLVPAHDVLFDDIKSHLEAAQREDKQ